MARKSSKARKTAKRKRYRKILDVLLTRHVSEAVLAGETSVRVAVATLREPARSRATEIAEHLLTSNVTKGLTAPPVDVTVVSQGDRVASPLR